MGAHGLATKTHHDQLTARDVPAIRISVTAVEARDVDRGPASGVPSPLIEDPAAPSGAPGTHAPHVALTGQAARWI
jgi:hypothetical protein